MKSEHIEEDRLYQFATEAIDDLSDAENIHLDDCDKCRRRLVVVVQFAICEEATSEATYRTMVPLHSHAPKSIRSFNAFVHVFCWVISLN